MLQADLNRILKLEEKAILSTDLLSKLEKDLEQNPWFQMGWLLLAKMKFHQQSSSYNETLGKAAAYAIDRAHLFDFIYHTSLTTKAVATKPVEEKEVAKTSKKDIKTKEELERKISERVRKIEEQKDEAKEIPQKPKKEVQELVPEVKEEVVLEPIEIKEEIQEEKIEVIEELPTEEKEQEIAQVDEEEELKEPTLEEENQQIDEEERERHQQNLIDRFIQNQPSVNRPSDADYSEGVAIAKASLEDRLDFVSETLAKIYMNQGNKKKAIEIYKQLSLKYPEKKLYFAAQIQNLNK